MVNILKLLLQHIKEYCEAAAIHGPQHIVSRNLTRLERLVSYRYMFLRRQDFGLFGPHPPL